MGRSSGSAAKAAVALLAAAASGCYGSSDMFGEDSSSDSGVAVDSSTDTMPDTVPDTVPDTEIDTSMDTPADTWLDTWMDTWLDSAPPDSYPDAWWDSWMDSWMDTGWEIPDSTHDSWPDPIADTPADTHADSVIDVPVDVHPPAEVGDGCTVDGACAGIGAGAYCMTDLYGYFYFPGGYCTMDCWDSTECGDAGSCVDVIFSTLCLQTCTASSECRTSEGYDCMPLPFIGGGPYCLPTG